MIYLLFFALCCMFIIAYLINQKDILSPWVITIGMFLVSTVFAILNIETWDFQLSSITVIVILSGVFAFGVGELLVSAMFEKHGKAKSIVHTKKANRIEVQGWILAVIVIGMICGLLVMVKQTYDMSLQAGNPGGLATMLEYARKLYIQPGYTIGKASIHISLMGKALSAIFLYFFMNNVFYDKKKRDILYLFPVVLYLGMAALGTGRTFMIEFLGMALIFGLIIERKKNNWVTISIVKVALIAVAALLIFFIFFFLFGFITGKSQGTKLFDMVSVYTGMSIPSLDVWLNKAKDIPTVFGEETMYGVTSVLRKLNIIQYLRETVRHLEFVDFGDATGNVYTCFRRYINDFGYVGMLLVQTAVGSFYSVFYNNIKRENGFGILLIFYGILMYPLLMQSIDELILSSYLSTSYVYLVIYILVFYFILIKGGKKKVGNLNEH